jgi:hypothetical protein
MEIQIHGDTDTWRYRYIEIQIHGDTDTWRYRYIEIKLGITLSESGSE